MGITYNEITLKNALDVGDVRRGLIKKNEIRQVTVQALVDTGAWTIVINEETREKLGLEVTGYEDSMLADGTKDLFYLVGPLEVWWEDRHHVCEAILMPNATDILLGAIPLEGMDLTINPKRGLVGKHGDKIFHRL